MKILDNDDLNILKKYGNFNKRKTQGKSAVFLIPGDIQSNVFRQGTCFLLPELRVDASSKTVHSQTKAKEAAAPGVHSCAHHGLRHLRGVAPHAREEEAHVSGAQHPDPPHHRGKPGALLHQTQDCQTYDLLSS